MAFKARSGWVSAKLAGLGKRVTRRSLGAYSCIWLQKVQRQLRRIQTQQRMAVGRQQRRHAAQQAGIVIGGDEAAFLLTARVGDDKVIQAAACKLAHELNRCRAPESWPRHARR